MHLLVMLVTSTCLFLPCPPAAAILAKPRILSSLPLNGTRFLFDKEENEMVLYHEPGNPSVHVGAEDMLYLFNFSNETNLPKIQRVNFTATDHSQCSQEPRTHCKNYLTVLQTFQGKLLVCGTNAYNPTCWNLIDTNKTEPIPRPGFSPFVPDKNHLILFSGSNVYSTIVKRQNNGKIPRFRRVHGETPLLYTNDNLMINPHYVKVQLVEKEQSYEAKIYLFFREDNLEKNVDADITVSRVAQLCKEDGGGEGGQNSGMWSTFLKARLECGYPDNGRFYSRLHDVFTIRCEKLKETRVYGVFSSPWNDTAVCVYTMGDIERVFQTSPLKGNTDKKDSTIRPGECLEGKRKTPEAIFTMASEHPEMEQGVEPIGKKPLFHSHAHYRRIVVDQVNATDETSYNVLLLTTVNGTIHKFLEINQSVVNILEIQPFRTPAPIQSMELDSIQKRVYVSSSLEVVEVPLDWCGGYQQSCESCVMARDPYCGWKNEKCVSILQNRRWTIQNITHGNPRWCYDIRKTERLPMLRNDSSEHSVISFWVRPFSRHFFSCPVVSHHSKYSWIHNNTIRHDCLLDQSSQQCIHLIENVADDQYGTYRCEAKEGEITQNMAEYELLRDSTEMPEAARFVGGHGTLAAGSLWLIVLQMVACYLLLQ